MEWGGIATLNYTDTILGNMPVIYLSWQHFVLDFISIFYYNLCLSLYRHLLIVYLLIVTKAVADGRVSRFPQKLPFKIDLSPGG